MSKNTLKLLIWLVLSIVVVVAAAAIVSGLSKVLASFQQGADPASALNLVPNKPPDLQVRIAWLPDDVDTGRVMEPLTRQQLESAYVRAWLQWHISYLRGEPYGLESYFVGPALAAVETAVIDAAANGWAVDQVDLAHTLQLHLYAADGSIAAFTAHDVELAQLIRAADGRQIFAGTTRADYDVVMMLEDGNWRVRHWVRRTAEVTETAVSPPLPAPGIAAVRDNQILMNGVPFVVRGINYYPQATPWDQFWPAYDPQVIDTDMTRIANLGLNTIRIFVPFAQFGGADVDADMLVNLVNFLDRAAAHDLKVIVTLFDFRTDYQMLLWPQADRHLEAVVPALANHPALLAWDLKNEPDLDYDANSPAVVQAWLAHTAVKVRALDPNHLLTVGWSRAAAAAALAEVVDVVSFHDYGEPERFHERYLALRTAVPHKPILLTEFGLPTWDGFFPGGHTEVEQAAHMAALLQTLRQTDSAGYVAWTLYDFSNVPASVVGRLPWRVAPQHHFGLLRSDGTTKPAAFLLAAEAPLDAPPFTNWQWVTRRFSLGIMGLLVMGAALFAARRRLRRRRLPH